MNFRKLKEEEIECRVDMIRDNGLSLLLYKNARCDMNILDETVGAENWERDHKELKENIYCGVGIWFDNLKRYVWKWDCGAESYTEKEKGEASDSFKRACFNWGIGRELYTAPFIWIKPSDCDIYKNSKGKLACSNKFYVEKISYDESGKINGLAIRIKDKTIEREDGTIQKKDMRVYVYNNTKTAAEQQ